MTQTNFSTKQKQTYRAQTCLVKEAGGGGGKTGWKFEASVCKLLDIRITKLLHCI